MKKKWIAVFAVTLLAGCEQKTQQYFTASPEIDLVVKSHDAYFKGDFSAMRSMYADTASIYDNTWDEKSALTTDDWIKRLQEGQDNYSEITMGNIIKEMIVTNDGEKWVHTWFQWNAVHKNGTKLSVPIHTGSRIVGDKIAFQVNFYNTLPMYLANNPAPAEATGDME